MIYELDAASYEQVRPLFAPLDYELIIAAALDRTTWSRVVVDDVERPQSALMQTAEGTFLVGRDDNTAFNDGLRQFIRETIFGDGGEGELYVCVHPGAWVARLQGLAQRAPIPLPRRRYVYRSLKLDWSAQVPEGCIVQRIDAALLDRQDLEIPAHISNWMRSNWGSREAFLERGFGFCVTDGTGVASWSLADCRSGHRCEIGIHTAPDYRRRGLATLTAAATVDYALKDGFREVGWHCNADNVGSWRTAEKVGFELADEYMMYFIHHG